jgi:hypothetical protein
MCQKMGKSSSRLSPFPKNIEPYKDCLFSEYTVQFKKIYTRSYVYWELISEPTIMWYASVARETPSVLNLKVINTQCGHPVSHGTHQVDNPIPVILSPASLPLWLLPLWRSVALIPEDHGEGWPIDGVLHVLLRGRSSRDNLQWIVLFSFTCPVLCKLSWFLLKFTIFEITVHT